MTQQPVKTWIITAFIAILAFAGIAAGADESGHVAIGVLATMDRGQCLEEWSETAVFLHQKIPGINFKILPLVYDEIQTAVRDGKVDFILANPLFYVELESRYGVNRIATLKNRCLGGACKTYGGVVFWLKKRKDINGIADLKGKRFMAANEHSLGGWLIIWRELKEQGLDPYRDFTSLTFGRAHDKVVQAVLEGRTDAGGVRTDILEYMAAEGKIRLEDFRILPNPAGNQKARPYLCSTREYPEWPMAKLSRTSDDLAEKVSIALLQMSPDEKAAISARCAGWTIPLNYQSVHDCLRFLKVGPYQDIDKISAKDVFRTYWRWLLAAFAAFLGSAVFAGVILSLNRKIRDSHGRLKAEISEHRKTDAALKTAKELAEAATHTKSEFLANMSHEIRTPMNGVIAAAELVMNEKLPPKAERYLKIIHSSAYSLLGLINDILDFSKIEAGKLSMDSKEFMLDEVVERVVNLFLNSAAEKHIELLVDIDPQTPGVLLGDPMRLQQILTNLVGNAVKFTEKPGFILIGANPSERSPEQVEIRFWVKDSGVGIPKDYLEQLFEPFTQADASDTRRYEGTGLGLSICKRLVGMMGGRIWVDSQLGHGSIFYFTARFGIRENNAAQEYKLPAENAALKILVVDDCAESVTIVSRMLKSFGFATENAASGSEAIEKIRNHKEIGHPLDLMVIDWIMPEMDGLEASRRIRQEIQSKLPIIIMTAFGRDTEKKEAEKIGVNAFLFKPVYPSTLFNAVMEALGRQGLLPDDHTSPITTDISVYKRGLKGFRVLVVEDNPTNREIAVAILESAGMLSETAVNGKQALALLNTQPFDVILMDIQMPEMNGYEATQQIRKDPAFHSLPIIALTARAMRGDEEHCLSVGMNGYIAKPISQQRLFQLLWRLLKNRRPADPPDNALNQEKQEETVSGRLVLPDHAAGLYIRETLEATKLDEPVYLRILNGFSAGNLNTAHQLETAARTNDSHQLTLLAHSLKGSAANIGARELESAARELESAASNPSETSEMQNLLDNVRNELNTVLTTIGSMENKPQEAFLAAAAPFGRPPEALHPTLVKLAQALTRSDPEESIHLLDELKTMIEAEPYSTMKRLINNYDYEEATQMVHALLQSTSTTDPGEFPGEFH